jgi:hypothetical protein
MELLNKLHLQTRLLPGFPHCCLLQALPIVAIPPGNGPQAWLISAQDQDKPPFLLNDDIDGGEGIAIFSDHRSTFGIT